MHELISDVIRMRKTVIGVMGPGESATETDKKNAYRLGELIAENGWILLSGGRTPGVMGAVNKGAKSKNGFTVGILPNDDKSTWSDDLDIQISTKLGSARNVINALSSDIVVAVGMSAGTASEVVFAIQADKPIILLGNSSKSVDFFREIGKGINVAKTSEEAIAIIKKSLGK